mmetsp:Transcript_38864/g.28149  ORF Transcript_38864/g.28149 Transcript_38864/m.28149 type:complete len:210 (+) Transcript_38864:172-801(+)|eukprot:CAMPEP_0116886258 /NCGR_PEP_ID=MMETSP0463-20121206/19996_1 /TAXON_ID=181622 /ORGANISM="Strombidinopsis sp, Strain SopsisLIS2011" /LENGTH=209 /DNA_ID=CAMNT_0004546275 /DNA_START=163 /DNA_END=792 /DNA_ORIENTATION=+
MIEKDFNFKTFSMGEYFRSVINSSDTHGEESQFVTNLRKTLRAGHFVDDETALGVIKNVVDSKVYGDFPGLILDGMPRTLPQAEKLHGMMGINLVVNFLNREDILLEKLMGRRVCPSCGTNYNVADINRDGYVMPPLAPKEDGICDHCPGVQLIIRDDDKETIIKERMEIYRSKTEPIIDFFKERDENKVVDFEAKLGKDDYPKLRKLL